MTDRPKVQCCYSADELMDEIVAMSASIKNETFFSFTKMKDDPEVSEMVNKAISFQKNLSLKPRNPELRHLSGFELIEKLMVCNGYRIKQDWRGVWEHDDRKDFYEIACPGVKKNADCVVAICLKDNLLNKLNRRPISFLRTKTFGKAFKLSETEPFFSQPVAKGRMSTGFLVQPDLIATAAHCIHGVDVTELRFVFDYKITNPHKVVHAEQVPTENIYNGVKVVDSNYNVKITSDWALVKLDREVKNRPIATISKSEVICGHPVYVLGHPCGLPLKYAAGAQVSEVQTACFVADLDVFAGNSGSPVFHQHTHEVLGIVVQGDSRNFMLTPKGWITVVFPNSEFHSNKSRCTRSSEFARFCCPN